MYGFYIDSEIMLGFLGIEDTDKLMRLVDKNRDYLRVWLPWLDNILQPEDATRLILNLLEQYRTNNGFQFGIWYKGELCGIIGLQGVNWSNRSTSIGYWLDEEHQGKGIITRSCIAVIDIAFKEMSLNRIEIRCAEQNNKSKAVPERLGFMVEGVMRDAEWLYDHYVNHIIYSILAGEWQAKNEDTVMPE